MEQDVVESLRESLPAGIQNPEEIFELLKGSADQKALKRIRELVKKAQSRSDLDVQPVTAADLGSIVYTGDLESYYWAEGLENAFLNTAYNRLAGSVIEYGFFEKFYREATSGNFKDRAKFNRETDPNFKLEPFRTAITQAIEELRNDCPLDELFMANQDSKITMLTELVNEFTDDINNRSQELEIQYKLMLKYGHDPVKEKSIGAQIMDLSRKLAESENTLYLKLRPDIESERGTTSRIFEINLGKRIFPVQLFESPTVTKILVLSSDTEDARVHAVEPIISIEFALPAKLTFDGSPQYALRSIYINDLGLQAIEASGLNAPKIGEAKKFTLEEVSEAYKFILELLQNRLSFS